VWIDEVVDDVVKIQKCFCSCVVVESAAHGAESVGEFAVVSFNAIVVVLFSCEVCVDRCARREFGNAREECVERVFVVGKFVADERDEVSLFLGFVLFFFVLFEDLFVACCFDLSEECCAFLFGSMHDKKVCGDVFCDVIFAVEIVPLFAVDEDDFFIHVLSSFESWFDV